MGRWQSSGGEAGGASQPCWCRSMSPRGSGSPAAAGSGCANGHGWARCAGEASSRAGPSQHRLGNTGFVVPLHPGTAALPFLLPPPSQSVAPPGHSLCCACGAEGCVGPSCGHEPGLTTPGDQGWDSQCPQLSPAVCGLWLTAVKLDRLGVPALGHRCRAGDPLHPPFHFACSCDTWCQLLPSEHPRASTRVQGCSGQHSQRSAKEK